MTQSKIYGAICHAGGRKIEITSEHQEWLDWALKALYEQASKDSKVIHCCAGIGYANSPNLKAL